MVAVPIPNTKDFMDLTGQKFNRLTVVSYAGKVGPSHRLRTSWNCVCDCGAHTLVVGHRLRSGHTTSCGCYRKTKSYRHGLNDSTERQSWMAMLRRCYKPSQRGYENYGGRGITVCDEWRGTNGLATFVAHIGRKPAAGYSVDRIDNNKGYEPGNVRWSNRKEQANNRRTNLFVTYNGKTQSVSDWADELNIPYRVVYSRLHKMKWSPEKAFTTPIDHSMYRKRRSKRFCDPQKIRTTQ